MRHRLVTSADCQLLGELNHQLIRDEGHRNPMTASDLAERMRNWLKGEYTAMLFEKDGEVFAYALYRQQPSETCLRQHFVVRHRRRQGVGRQIVKILMEQIWARDVRLTVEVLVTNTAAVSFWRNVGYRDYSLTLEIMPPV